MPKIYENKKLTEKEKELIKKALKYYRNEKTLMGLNAKALFELADDCQDIIFKLDNFYIGE